MSKHDPASLYAGVSHLINTILNLEKGRVFEVEGQRIYPSEVHLLLAIADHPDDTATDLANRLAVTKGAVSQTVTRLVAKGLLIKSKDAGGGNTLRLEFTPDGVRTVAHFRRRTTGLRRGVEAHLAELTPAQREVVAGFLGQLTRELDDLGRP